MISAQIFVYPLNTWSLDPTMNEFLINKFEKKVILGKQPILY